jgi:gliding motility-associated-like protein
VNATGTITVITVNTVTGPGSATVCINTAMAPALTQTTTGATGIGAASGLPAGVTASFAGNTITISGTPTVAGTYNYSIPLTGGCGTVNATGTITVNPDNTVTGPGSSTLCINTAMAPAITHTTTGATGIGAASGLPAGVTASFAGNTITISGTPTVAGTYNYSIPLTGGCGTVNATGTITVNPDNTVTGPGSATVCINIAMAPALTQTTTGATGIGAASGLPAGVTASFAGNTITISGTPTVAGTYNYSIPLTGGCGTVNATGTITVNPDNTVTGPGSATLCINTAMAPAITHTTTGATGIGAASGLPAGVTATFAGNTITISGTPTVAGTYNYSIPLTGGCGTVSATGTITVNPDNTVTGPGSATLCANTVLAPVITHTTTGATGIGAASGLPAGVTASFAGNTITISGTPTIAGTYNYSIPLTGGCGTVNATGTITVNPEPVFAVTTSDPSGCGNSDGTITFTGLTPAGSYDVTYNDGATPVTLNGQIADGSGNIVISGQNAGSYGTFVVDDGNCTYTVTGPFTLTDPSSPTFTLSYTDPTTCGGTEGSITLSGLNPSTTYDISYDDGSVVTLNGVTTDASGDYVITGLGAGTYSGFVVVLSGCTGTNNGPITLTDPSAPVAPVAGTDATYCDGDAIADLTATPGSGGTINWYDDAGLTNLVGTGNTLTPASGVGITTYYATETVANCESTGTPVTITINLVPSAPTAGTDATYCDGDAIADMTATAGFGGTLNWYDDAGLTNLVGTGSPVSPSGALGITTYYVTETLNGCTGPASTVTITVNPTPSFAIGTTTDPTGCGASDGTITITGLNASSSYDVTYDDGTGTVALGTITTDASGNYVINGLPAGNYSNFTVTLGSCPQTLAGPVTLSDPGAPVFTVTPSNPSGCGLTDGTITISGLNASSTYDITYDDGSVVSLIGVTTDASGNYVISGLGAGSYSNFTVTIAGCTGNDGGPYVLVDPSAPVAPVAGTDATYCDGDALTDLTATAGSGGTLNWYDDAGLSNNIGSGVNLTPVNTVGTTVYYVTETVAGCESPAAQVTIIINPTPVAPTAGADATYCDGDPIADLTATAGSGGTLNWYDDAGLSNLVGTGSPFTPSTAVGSTTYYATETLGSCESPATLITITVNPTPSFTIGTVTNPTSCGGNDGSIELTGLNASSSYDVSYDDGTGTISLGSITTDASGNYLITGLTAGNYSNITVTLGSCSLVQGPVSLNDPGAPTFTVSYTDPTTCGGTDGTITISGLSASSNYDVSYDNGSAVNLGTITTDATGNYVITGLSAGTYASVTVDLAGCVSADATVMNLTDPAAPTFTVSSSNPTTCGGNDGSITISGLTASTTYDVTYDDGTGTISLGSITTDASGNYVISGLAAGSYTNITVTIASCTGTEPGPLTLTDPGAPAFTVSSVNPSTCNGTDGSITLTGLTASTSYDVTYDDGTGTINLGTITTDASGNYVITGLPAGSYSNFTVTFAGCTTTEPGPVALTDPGAPAAPVAGTDASYCSGDAMADLTATAVSGTITWYSDAGLTTVLGTGATLTPSGSLGSTTYYVTETSGGCESPASLVTVTVNAIPASPSAGSDASYCVDDVMADMTATAGAGGSLTWYNDAGLTNVVGSGTTETPANVAGVTTYYVTESVSGCESTPATVVITVTDCDTTVLVLEIPTGFTPDGDGTNDEWEIVNITAMYPEAIVKIYNRWGNILFTSDKGYTTRWDGKYNGESLPVASYYFIIEFNDGSTEPATGSVTIIRRD